MPTITCSKCGSRQESREYFVLEGDTFYTFECGECTNNAPVFSRHSLKWLTLTHLVLFHLSATTTNKDTRFFAWKDGICAFIDAHWDKLLPGRARSLTWQNTLAKELSTHPDIFVAGKLQAGNLKGFWALVDPSVPPSASSDTVKKTQKVKAEKRSSVDSPVDPATSSTQQQQQQQPPQKKQRKKKESTPTVDSVPDTINQPILPPVAPTAPPIVEHTLPVQQSLPPPATLATLSKKEQIHPQHAGKQPRKGPVIHSDLEENQLPSNQPHQPQIPQLHILTPHQSYTLIQKLNPTIPTLARLRRRLLLLQSQKLRSLKRVDLDVIASRSIKEFRPDPEPMPRVSEDQINGLGVKWDLDAEGKAVVVVSKQDIEFDKVVQQRVERVKAHKIDEIHPLFRFSTHVTGIPHFRNTLAPPVPFISPYTEHTLKPYIWRDFLHLRKPQQLAPRYQLLEFIQSLDSEAIYPTEPASIDYVHFHDRHLSQVNEMLSRQFWPGIDVTEHLSRPDLSVIALYKRVVVGCAFILPDGYISYIMVLPGWQRAGIARFMMHHLLQCVQSYGKDVTLHVSANNPAMMLYQSFGFKAEEFVVNFYDKYLPEGSRECRNALFLRRRR